MWNLYENNRLLQPLVFSNGKNQEDVSREVLDAIKEGSKVIFIKGMCGTGKSAIALNIAKGLGKASVVVPFKALQKQYEDDYTNKKYLLKESGKNIENSRNNIHSYNENKFKIKVITGRANHLCPFLQENPQLDLINRRKAKNLKVGEKNSTLDVYDGKFENKRADEGLRRGRPGVPKLPSPARRSRLRARGAVPPGNGDVAPGLVRRRRAPAGKRDIR